MEYLAVLGRQAKISLAELETLFTDVQPLGPSLASFTAAETPDIRRLGGTQKIAIPITSTLQEWLRNLPETGKITLGVSDFSRRATAKTAMTEALRLKRQLVQVGRSVRVVPNQTAVLSSAVSFHNHLITDNKIELIKINRDYYRVTSLQNINDYVRRDRERPARDAKVGMLPPKLAQILLNLCGNLPAGSRILDPFCGTGVVLQEASLIGYATQGTDLSERMVEYTKRNLRWLENKFSLALTEPIIEQGDATSHHWIAPIAAVACETYLGPPMSNIPSEMELKTAKQECSSILRGFLRNLAKQIQPGTPVVIAIPAWLRPNRQYQRLNLLDEIDNLGYNVMSFKNLEQSDLLYHREGQIVAREIIVLRKKEDVTR